MYGKTKCKILKEIRKRIASENEIPFVTRECTYQGNCRGTCPKCEEELRYLEQQLEKRQRLGKAVAVSALSLSLLTGSAACEPLFGEKPLDPLEGDVPYVETQPSDPDELPGRFADFESLEGEPTEDPSASSMDETESTEEPFLEGYVAYVVPETYDEYILGMAPFVSEESSEEATDDE